MSIYTCAYCDKDLPDSLERFSHPTDDNLCCEECAGKEHPLDWTVSDRLRYWQRPSELEALSFDEWLALGLPDEEE